MDFAAILLQKLGLNPDDVKNAVVKLIGDAAMVKNEILAGKAGFVQAMQHFDGRLTRIEQSLARIENALGTTPNQILLEHENDGRNLNGG